MSPATTRHAEPDQACAEAVDQARTAAEEVAGAGQVGPHVGMQVEADRIVTHLFDCLSPGYVGWRWAVTVTRAARSKVVTVNESVLLPGPDSLLAPAWVPWTERVRPGDLKPGDLMPARSDDERLVPFVAISGEAGLLDWDESDAWSLGAGTGAAGVTAAIDAGAEADAGVEAEPEAGAEAGPGTEAAAAEPGAQPPAATAGQGRRAARRPGRGGARPVRAIRPARVLSAIGRDEAALRWYTGASGPDSPLAVAAPAHCQTCGFMVRLGGPLGRVFGVCANEFAPDDGKVVSMDHGCGAHSDGAVAADGVAAGIEPTVDELGFDMLNAGPGLPDSVLENLDHELL